MLNQHDQLVLRLRGLPNWNKVKPTRSSSYDLLHLITFLGKFNSYSPKMQVNGGEYLPSRKAASYKSIIFTDSGE